MNSLKTLLAALVICLPLFASAQQDFVGNWKTAIAMEDGSSLPTSVSILDDGSYTIDFGIDGQVDVKGQYVIEGERVTIVDQVTLAVECAGVKGVYRFTADASTLVMEKIDDPCPGRGGEGPMRYTRM